MADDEHADEHDYRDGKDAGGTLETRVGALESGQETMSGKLDQVLSMLGGGGKEPAGQPAQQGGGQPEDGIAMEIRKQLDERNAKAAADEEKASTAREVDSLKQQVQQLSERKPEAPVRRVEKLMGWR